MKTRNIEGVYPRLEAQRVALRALRVLLRYDFEEMQFSRIQATTHTENHRRMRVLEKLGFQRQGLLSELLAERIYNDQALFSLLRKECAGEGGRL